MRAVGHINLEEDIVCGGGLHNTYLLSCLRERLAQLGATSVESTADYGVDPDAVEAIACALLA